MPHPWLKRNVATMANLWTDPEHALDYLGRADTIPHRAEGESVLLDHLSDQLDRVLDLGCGDGRLLALVLSARPGASGMALDFSPAMLEKAQMRFSDHPSVEVRAHDLDQPLSLTGPFDAVVSSFAIHHVSDRRKQNLYSEVFDLLGPGGIFLIWSMWPLPPRGCIIASCPVWARLRSRRTHPTSWLGWSRSSAGCGPLASRTWTATGSGWSSPSWPVCDQVHLEAPKVGLWSPLIP